MSRTKLNQYGWDVNDVVAFEKTWCTMCTKARMHEVYGVHMICLNPDCSYVTVKDKTKAQEN